VITYVLQRLGLAAAASPTTTGSDQRLSPAAPVSDAPLRGAPIADIRSFTEQKKPRTANEMAAVVAYYLSEVAREPERKTEVSAADIEKYFKQAPFRLPAAARMTLTNAKNAGYLDPGTEKGTFKLNPVGHNLVAHALPAAGGTKRRTSAKRSRRRKSRRNKRSE
jgi:hypothetical protein